MIFSASQCFGVDRRLNETNVPPVPAYKAWSFQTRALGGYSGNCCCKNTLTGLGPITTSIMGLSNCLGSGKIA